VAIALGRKASDEFATGLCQIHRRLAHHQASQQCHGESRSDPEVRDGSCPGLVGLYPIGPVTIMPPTNRRPRRGSIREFGDAWHDKSIDGEGLIDGPGTLLHVNYVP